MSENSFSEWAVLELMGHRKLAGLVTEQVIGAATFIRIDIYIKGDKPTSTQFYNPSAIYCMTPVSEALARQCAVNNMPAPVARWELPQIEEPREKEKTDAINKHTGEDHTECCDLEDMDLPF